MNELETDKTPALAPNPFLRSLRLGGFALLALGVIIAISGKTNAEDELIGQRIRLAMSGTYSDSAPVDAAFGWMWFGVVLAVAGAVLLTIWVSIRAASSS